MTTDTLNALLDSNHNLSTLAPDYGRSAELVAELVRPEPASQLVASLVNSVKVNNAIESSLRAAEYAERCAELEASRTNFWING